MPTKGAEVFIELTAKDSGFSAFLDQMDARTSKFGGSAERTFLETRTAAEKFKASLRDVSSQFTAGEISADTWHRAVQQLEVDYAEASGAAAIFRREMAEAGRITQAVQTPLERYNANLAMADNLLKKGHISQGTFNRFLAQQQTVLNSANRGYQSATLGSGRFSNALQQASYGVQDFVQVMDQGLGASLRASVNNFAQVLAVISPMAGAIGGLAVTALGIYIANTMNATEETDRFADSLTKLGAAAERMSDITRKIRAGVAFQRELKDLVASGDLAGALKLKERLEDDLEANKDATRVNKALRDKAIKDRIDESTPEERQRLGQLVADKMDPVHRAQMFSRTTQTREEILENLGNNAIRRGDVDANMFADALSEDDRKEFEAAIKQLNDVFTNSDEAAKTAAFRLGELNRVMGEIAGKETARNIKKNIEEQEQARVKEAEADARKRTEATRAEQDLSRRQRESRRLGMDILKDLDPAKGRINDVFANLDDRLTNIAGDTTLTKEQREERRGLAFDAADKQLGALEKVGPGSQPVFSGFSEFGKSIQQSISGGDQTQKNIEKNTAELAKIAKDQLKAFRSGGKNPVAAVFGAGK